MHFYNTQTPLFKITLAKTTKLLHNYIFRARSSVGLEYLATNQGVVGSNPAGRANPKTDLRVFFQVRFAFLPFYFLTLSYHKKPSNHKLDRQISHQKIPRYIRLVEEFPMTASGKIQKFKIREMMAEELAQ